jgi:hypothetical protein
LNVTINKKGGTIVNYRKKDKSLIEDKGITRRGLLLNAGKIAAGTALVTTGGLTLASKSLAKKKVRKLLLICVSQRYS